MPSNELEGWSVVGRQGIWVGHEGPQQHWQTITRPEQNPVCMYVAVHLGQAKDTNVGVARTQ